MLSNIAPLREMSPSLARVPLHLYTPSLVTRGVNSASFQYYLGRKADSVHVEILDATGKRIRSFDGAPGDTALKATPYNTPGCDPKRPVPRRASVKAGLNTFTWDARYPGASEFDCMILWGGNAVNGPKAPPGVYTVRIFANGLTQSKQFTVRRDPRIIGVTDADLREQFDLAQKINDKTDLANKAVIRIRSIREQLRDRVLTSRRPDVTQEYTELAKELDRLEGELYQTRNRSGQDPLNFPIKLNNRLTSLRRSVESGDARPTAASYVVFRELSAELDRHLAALKKLETEGITKFNEAAPGWGVKPISLTDEKR